jgi:ABC-type transport system involved in cytochrome bd biosynthesis fused ATPase/permease subunit
MGLILKEKDFREALKTADWTQYQDKNVAITCSVDAIIPVWAYMLVATYLQPVAKEVYVGTSAELQKHLFLKNLAAIDLGRICRPACGGERLR